MFSKYRFIFDIVDLHYYIGIKLDSICLLFNI